jgi:hypothetical protein
MSDVTRILTAIENGDSSAADELLPLVYQELRKLAAAKLAKENAGQTLQPTVLVHEAYLRLVDSHATLPPRSLPTAKIERLIDEQIRGVGHNPGVISAHWLRPGSEPRTVELDRSLMQSVGASVLHCPGTRNRYRWPYRKRLIQLSPFCFRPSMGIGGRHS